MGEAAASRSWTRLRITQYALGAVAVLLLALVFSLGAFYWWMVGGVFRQSRYDAALWFAPQTNLTDSTCYRGGMATDVKDRLLQPGMTHEDVERLLGKPDGRSTQGEHQYILGMCSGFGMDYDNLHIYFDSNGKYTHAAIFQH